MKVIIIDDEWLIRVELIQLLKKYKNIKVVGEAANISEAITLINETKPDLIFLDIHMEDKDGFDDLIIANRNCKTVCLSVFDEKDTEKDEDNIVGYLSKPINAKKLCDVVKKL